MAGALTPTDLTAAALRGIDSVSWAPGYRVVDGLNEAAVADLAAAAAREVLAEITKVLVGHYPDPNRPYAVVDVGARLGIRVVAEALGIDLDAAMAQGAGRAPIADRPAS